MQASWLTTLMGSLVIIGDVGAFVSKFMSENTAPITPEQWFGYFMGLVTGIGLILAKQFNVSNAPRPAAPAVVSAINAATPNPSSVQPVPPAVKP